MDWILEKLTQWQPFSIFISALATIVLAIVAVFQDRLRSWVFSPKLDVEQGPFYPDPVKIPLTDGDGNFVTEACYLQIRIKNDGTTAEKVEVFIAKIEKEINGIFHKVESFYPLNLKWRHYGTIFLDRLSPNTGRDCTLGRIVNPQQKQKVGDDNPLLNIPQDRSPFRLDLATIPNTRSDLLSPGRYRLFLEIGASNTRHPKKRMIELEFTGEWLTETKDMAVARLI